MVMLWREGAGCWAWGCQEVGSWDPPPGLPLGAPAVLGRRARHAHRGGGRGDLKHEAGYELSKFL